MLVVNVRQNIFALFYTNRFVFQNSFYMFHQQEIFTYPLEWTTRVFVFKFSLQPSLVG